MAQNKDQPSAMNLEDTMLVAFLKLKGHNAIPWICTDDDNVNKGRVVFDIIGDPDRVAKDKRAYYENEPVGVQDYVRCLKATKSEMYDLKKTVQG